MTATAAVATAKTTVGARASVRKDWEPDAGDSRKIEVPHHLENTSVERVFHGVQCPQCGLDGVVIDGQPLGLAGKPPTYGAPPKPPSRQAFRAKLRAAEAEVRRLRGELAEKEE